MDKAALAQVFTYLCFAMLFLLVIWARQGALMTDISKQSRNKFYLWATIPTVVWLTIILMLTSQKFFHSFNEMPPRQLLFFVPPMLALILVLRSKLLVEVLKSTPVVWLIAIQSFRIVVEAILYGLHKIDELPALMTFEGQNFDIIVGVTAPIVALLLSKGIITKKHAIIWNYIGILILGITVVSAILAIPTKFQVINAGVDMRNIGKMPWTMLPSFLVPIAFYCHAMSIKQLRLKKEE